MNKQKSIVTFIAVCVIAILVTGVKVTQPNATSQTASSATQSNTSASDDSASASYKDGTYMADGDYRSPGGNESIAVSVTLANNTIADATVAAKAAGGVAEIYQSYFVNNYKGLVVGKNIDQVKLSRVSGSSLTSKGFNEALTKIKAEAKN